MTGRTTEYGTLRVKTGLAEMLKGGVIMDVVDAEQSRIAEEAGACAVMALERVPADIRRDGGVARMSDPDKKVKLVLVYPMTTGRNFDEVLRVIDSLQLTAKHRVATPVNWQQGDKVIIAGSVSNDEAKEIWPDGWESPKPYIRIVPQPESAVLTETAS